MQRISTTVLGLVGSPEQARLRAHVQRLGGYGNVRAVLPPAQDSALTRAMAAWAEAARTHLAFVVHDAEQLGATERHWYLGVLAQAALRRVVLVDDDHDALVHAVRRLRAGRWWPPLDRLLEGIDRRVPDQVDLGSRKTTPVGEPG